MPLPSTSPSKANGALKDETNKYLSTKGPTKSSLDLSNEYLHGTSADASTDNKSTANCTKQLKCVYSYTADADDYLSCAAGETLTLIDECSSYSTSDATCKSQHYKNNTAKREWMIVRNKDGKIGKIPKYYLQSTDDEIVAKHPWLLQNATRSEADHLLSDKKPGTFLIRASHHYPGNFTLSVKSNSTVEHYRIKCVKGCYTIDDERFFEDMLQLIEHYRLNADGLCEYLRTPVSLAYQDDAPTIQAQSSSTNVYIDWDLFIQRNVFIDCSSLIVLKRIGEGEHGRVFLGKISIMGKQENVAVKSFWKNKAAVRFLQESRMLICFDCAYIIRFIGVTEFHGNPCIITEYMAGGNVLDYLISRGRNVVSSDELLSFARDACQALEYLQQWKIVHRDVAASNVLLDNTHRAKLSDFGLAYFEQNENCPPTGKVRVKWTAPEALDKKLYSTMSDVWSYGVYLWELYSFGRQPYPRICNSDVLNWLKMGNRMEAPIDCPERIAHVMVKCWAVDAFERPSFAEILATLSKLPTITDGYVKCTNKDNSSSTGDDEVL